eukprot:12189397-Karenia_brevis.AAC.1
MSACVGPSMQLVSWGQRANAAVFVPELSGLPVEAAQGICLPRNFLVKCVAGPSKFRALMPFISDRIPC